MLTISTAFVFCAVSQSVFGQFYGTGGGFGGFGAYGGCGQQVQHFGNECFQPETGQGTVVCVGQYNSNQIVVIAALIYNSSKKLLLILYYHFQLMDPLHMPMQGTLETTVLGKQLMVSCPLETPDFTIPIYKVIHG